MHATTAVRDQAAQNRNVAGNLGALAQQLASTASEGAQAASETKERVAALVRAGENVALEAAVLAELTAALRGASATLTGAIARFQENGATPTEIVPRPSTLPAHHERRD